MKTLMMLVVLGLCAGGCSTARQDVAAKPWSRDWLVGGGDKIIFKDRAAAAAFRQAFGPLHVRDSGSGRVVVLDDWFRIKWAFEQEDESVYNLPKEEGKR